MEPISAMYVDDEPDLLDLAKLYLEEKGSLELMVLPSARQALDHLKTHQYDVVISDYQMPGMDGIEFLKKFRARFDTVPFILFTGRGREEVVIEALDNGADSYIQKGGNPTAQFAELRQKIKITVERRRAQTALLESEKQYRQLVENSQEGIFIIQDEKVVFYNPKFKKMILSYGFSMEILQHQPFFFFLHPHDQEMVRDRYNRRIGWNETFPRYAFRVGNTTGNTHWWEIDAVRIEWNGRLATLNFSRDITEQYHLRQQISESEHRYRDLVESLPKTVMEFDDQYHLTFINKTGLDKFGYRQEDFVGNMSFTDLIIPDERDTVLDIFRRARDGESNPAHETNAIKKDGSTFPMMIYLSPIRQNEKISGFRVVCADISESKAMKYKLICANTKMKLLLLITSHDIQSRLTSLNGYLEHARRHTTDSSTTDSILKIGEIVQAITQQVEATKIFLAIGLNEPEWQKIEDIDEFLRRSLPMEEIQVHNNCQGLEIFADRQLKQVLYNLVDNTLRHGENASEVRLFYYRRGSELVLVYEDNGIGIPNPDKQHLFTYDGGKHTGLGLFLIREILAITGILISETGTPGCCARFEILIPAGKYRFVPLNEEKAD